MHGTGIGMGHPLHVIEIQIRMSIVIIVDFVSETVNIWWPLDGILAPRRHNFNTSFQSLIFQFHLHFTL